MHNTKQILFGLKETSRVGVYSNKGLHYPIQYDVLKGHYINKIIFEAGKDRFVFSPSVLTENCTFKSLDKRNKFKGIWVYDAKSKELVSYENRVTSCIIKYNISKTHLRRVRKYNITFQGKIFSNKEN